MAIDTSAGGIYLIGSLNYNSIYIGYVDIIVNSIDVAANSSNITVRWVYKKNKSDPWGAWNSGNSTKVTLRYNGTSSTVVAPFDLRNAAIGSTQILHQVRVDVPHNADGTKAINVGGTHVTNLNPPGWGTVTVADETVNLPTIPRASSFTLNQSTLYMTQSLVVTINRASPSFAHKVVYAFGDMAAEYSLPATTTTHTFPLPIAWANQVPNADRGVGSVTVYTYNGGTQIGSAYERIVLLVPEGLKPTVSSLMVARVDNEVPAAWGLYVQGKSKVKLTAEAEGTYESAITGYRISGDGYSGNGSVLQTGTINNSGTVTYNADVTDSRGRTAAKTVSITVQPYAPPQVLNTTECRRCLSNLALSDSGTYLRILPMGAFSSCTGKNPLSMKVRYMPAGGGWSGYTSLTNGTAALIGGGGISVDKSYTVEVTATDQFQSSTAVYSVSTSKSVMSILNNGNGVAFGKSAELDSMAEFAWPARFTGGIDPIILASGANLDTITKPGFYNCPMNTWAESMTNCPTKNAFSLRVEYSAGAYQEVTEYMTHSPKKFMRNHYNGSWGPWYGVYTEADKPPTDIPNLYVRGQANFDGDVHYAPGKACYFNGQAHFGTANIGAASISAANILSALKLPSQNPGEAVWRMLVGQNLRIATSGVSGAGVVNNFPPGMLIHMANDFDTGKRLLSIGHIWNGKYSDYSIIYNNANLTIATNSVGTVSIGNGENIRQTFICIPIHEYWEV